MTIPREPEGGRVSVTTRILEHLSGQEQVCTPSDLIHYVRKQCGLDRRQSRKLIDTLVCDNQLEYCDIHGRTCVGLSFNRPVRVSSRIVLMPPDIVIDAKPSDVVIRLNRGIAFGRGTHPTTRLCLIALTEVFAWSEKNEQRFLNALDVGTGTGVLAIAMALLGTDQVWACDIDAIARDEADKNVRLNGLELCIHIDETLSAETPCDLIVANLRFPTLIDLGANFKNRLRSEGYLVVSGLRIEEKDDLISRYAHLTLKPRWEACDNGWCALVFSRAEITQ